jgi:hypothetical protein
MKNECSYRDKDKIINMNFLDHKKIIHEIFLQIK